MREGVSEAVHSPCFPDVRSQQDGAGCRYIVFDALVWLAEANSGACLNRNSR